MLLSKGFSQKFTGFISWLQTLSLQRTLKQALSRFPLSILSLIILTLCLLPLSIRGYGILIFIDFGSFENSYFLSKLAAISAIGMVLFAAIRLYWEASQSDYKKLRTYYVIGSVFLILVFLILPSQEINFTLQNYFQIIFLGIATLALFLISPFVHSSSNSGLWSFWCCLSHNFIISYIFFGLTIAIGISLALFAASFLLGLNIEVSIYSTLWNLSIVSFGSWYFLASLPDIYNIQSNNDKNVYPQYLKFFAKYILPFIFGVYLLILYIYGLRILLTQDWPSNQTVTPIIWLIIFGFLTTTLLFPLLKELWARRLSQVIYISILPIMILYFLAVGVRVSEFGWTVSRYLLVIFGLWVVGMCFYFLISRRALLKVGVVSVVVLLLISSFGPWGMFAVSKESQLQRLREVLDRNGFLVNKRIQPTDKIFACSEGRDITKKIYNLIEHLVDNYGFESLRNLYRPEDWSEIENKMANVNAKLSSFYGYIPPPSRVQIKEILLEQTGLRTSYINAYCPPSQDKSGREKIIRKKLVLGYDAENSQKLDHIYGSQTVYNFFLSYYRSTERGNTDKLTLLIPLDNDNKLQLVATGNDSSFDNSESLDDDTLDDDTQNKDGFTRVELQLTNQPEIKIDVLANLQKLVFDKLDKRRLFSTDLFYSIYDIHLQMFLNTEPFSKKEPLVLIDRQRIGDFEVTMVVFRLQIYGDAVLNDESSFRLNRILWMQGIILVKNLGSDKNVMLDKDYS